MNSGPCLKRWTWWQFNEMTNFTVIIWVIWSIKFGKYRRAWNKTNLSPFKLAWCEYGPNNTEKFVFLETGNLNTTSKCHWAAFIGMNRAPSPTGSGLNEMSLLQLTVTIQSLRKIAKTLKISYNGVHYSLQRTAQTGSNQRSWWTT